MIRLLLDQGLPRSTVQYLPEQGFDVCHVADIDQSRASDVEITAMALDQGRTIVTLDSDFHRLLAISGANGPSVIRIRREGLRGADVANLVSQVADQLGEQIEDGAMVTVTELAVRLHRLPLRRVGSKTPRSNPH